MSDSTFVGLEYLQALREHYPGMLKDSSGRAVDEQLHTGFVESWLKAPGRVGQDREQRFEDIRTRRWSQDGKAWRLSGSLDLRRWAAHGAYKGLIQLKPATDLVLYSNLLWELQPRTIIEFGSLQGGSALWFADQLGVLAPGGAVHSFELCVECIHPRAEHPQLTFHRADLRDLSSLPEALFDNLPHPWLVVDDAHENLEELIPWVTMKMHAGDYLVVEDAFTDPTGDTVNKVMQALPLLGFLVDTRYADAFGYNVTCAPNGWWVKQ